MIFYFKLKKTYKTLIKICVEDDKNYYLFFTMKMYNDISFIDRNYLLDYSSKIVMSKTDLSLENMNVNTSDYLTQQMIYKIINKKYENLHLYFRYIDSNVFTGSILHKACSKVMPIPLFSYLFRLSSINEKLIEKEEKKILYPQSFRDSESNQLTKVFIYASVVLISSYLIKKIFF